MIYVKKSKNGNGILFNNYYDSQAKFQGLIIDIFLNSKNESAPIIVIDAAGILYLTEKHRDDLVCGGRSHRNYELYDRFYNDLTSIGAKVVTFADLNVQEVRSRQWLERRDNEYQDVCEIFDGIARGQSVAQILSAQTQSRALTSARHAVYQNAKKYGELYFCVVHEADAELAKYARDHNALAVIGKDSDFLIFEGKWEYWSSNDIDLDALTTRKFDRKELRKHLNLSQKQMPLFACLMSNDHTKYLNGQLQAFHRKLGHLYAKWLNVAAFIRQLDVSTSGLTEHGAAKISKRVFGACDSTEAHRMIWNGIQSYNLNFTVHRETDPILQKVMLRPPLYKMLTSPILTLTIAMYDMRVKNMGKSYTDITAELARKCVGVLFHARNPNYTFKLFAKWSHAKKWSSQTVAPIFPPSTCMPIIYYICLLWNVFIGFYLQ